MSSASFKVPKDEVRPWDEKKCVSTSYIVPDEMHAERGSQAVSEFMRANDMVALNTLQVMSDSYNCDLIKPTLFPHASAFGKQCDFFGPILGMSFARIQSYKANVNGDGIGYVLVEFVAEIGPKKYQCSPALSGWAYFFVACVGVPFGVVLSNLVNWLLG